MSSILFRNQRFVLFFSLAAFNKDSEAESRHSHLMFRREKLRQLLADENDRLQAELASMPLKFRTSSSMRPSVEELREARERLRRERMEEQEQEAKEKMLQHWKLNNPDFREVIA